MFTLAAENLRCRRRLFSRAPLTVYASGFPAPFRGPEAVKAGASSYVAAFDHRVTIEDRIAECDKVGVRWRMQAVHQGEYRGMPATGRTVTFTAIQWFCLSNGKIEEAWNRFDTLSVVQELGFFPKGDPPRMLFRVVAWL